MCSGATSVSMAAKAPSAQLETASIDSPACSVPVLEIKWNLLSSDWCLCECVCLFVWPAECVTKFVFCVGGTCFRESAVSEQESYV